MKKVLILATAFVAVAAAGSRPADMIPVYAGSVLELDDKDADSLISGGKARPELPGEKLQVVDRTDEAERAADERAAAVESPVAQMAAAVVMALQQMQTSALSSAA